MGLSEGGSPSRGRWASARVPLRRVKGEPLNPIRGYRRIQEGGGTISHHRRVARGVHECLCIVVVRVEVGVVESEGGVGYRRGVLQRIPERGQDTAGEGSGYSRGGQDTGIRRYQR